MLTWVVEERAAELLQGHEALDDLIVLPRGWLKSPRSSGSCGGACGPPGSIWPLEAQGLTKAAIAAWLSGAKRRIGFGGLWGREFSPWLNTELVDASDLHAVERNLALLKPLGIEPPAVRFPGPRACRPIATAAAAILRQLGLDRPLRLDQRGGRLALEALAGRCAMRPWPPTWAASWGLPSLVVWGNAEERAAGRADRRRSGEGTARAGPEDDAFRNWPRWPGGPAVRRLRHRPVAPGRRGGHALRRALWPLARREAWPLWTAARCGAKDAHARARRGSAATPRRSTWRPSSVADVRDACRQILSRPPGRAHSRMRLPMPRKSNVVAGSPGLAAARAACAGWRGTPRARAAWAGRRRGAGICRAACWPRRDANGRAADAAHRHLQYPRLQGARRTPRRGSRGQVPGRARFRRPAGSPRPPALAATRSSGRVGPAAGNWPGFSPPTRGVVSPATRATACSARGRSSFGNAFPCRTTAAAAIAMPC